MLDFMREVGSLQVVLSLVGLFFIFVAIISSADRKSSAYLLSLEQRILLGFVGMGLVLAGFLIHFPILMTDLGLYKPAYGNNQTQERARAEKAFIGYLGSELVSDTEVKLDSLRSEHAPGIVLEEMEEYLKDLIERAEALEHPAVAVGLVKCWGRLDISKLDLVIALGTTSLNAPLHVLRNRHFTFDEMEQKRTVEILVESLKSAKSQWSQLHLEANDCQGYPV